MTADMTFAAYYLLGVFLVYRNMDSFLRKLWGERYGVTRHWEADDVIGLLLWAFIWPLMLFAWWLLDSKDSHV